MAHEAMMKRKTFCKVPASITYKLMYCIRQGLEMETFQRRYVQYSVEESNSPHRLRHHLQEAARGRGDFPGNFPWEGSAQAR